MKTTTKIMTAALALGSALVSTGSASAQGWGGRDRGYEPSYNQGYNQSYGGGYGGYYRDPREQAAINRQLVDTTCSGQRGAMLENRLRLEVNRGQINGWTARRIQSSIYQLRDQERRECSQRDFRSARDIGKDYIRIRAWIDQETGGYRPVGYRR